MSRVRTKHFIISGSFDLPFANRLLQQTRISLAKLTLGCFINGEARVRIEEKIYEKTFYVAQSMPIICLPDYFNV